MLDANPNIIPISIEARTRTELSRKMLRLNQQAGKRHKFHSIQKDGDKWVAWYDVDTEHLVRGSANDS